MFYMPVYKALCESKCILEEVDKWNSPPPPCMMVLELARFSFKQKETRLLCECVPKKEVPNFGADLISVLSVRLNFRSPKFMGTESPHNHTNQMSMDV